MTVTSCFQGDTNHTITFHRPNGTIIGATTPPGPLMLSREIARRAPG